jgi:hypothetical protein
MPSREKKIRRKLRGWQVRIGISGGRKWTSECRMVNTLFNNLILNDLPLASLRDLHGECCRVGTVANSARRGHRNASSEQETGTRHRNKTPEQGIGTRHRNTTTGHDDGARVFSPNGVSLYDGPGCSHGIRIPPKSHAQRGGPNSRNTRDFLAEARNLNCGFWYCFSLVLCCKFTAAR